MKKRLPNRSGLSLIEIMVSLLVLSIGLLGILAAIPFGAFQLAKMKDADVATTTARKAFAAIEANHWDTPSPQFLCNLDVQIIRRFSNGANNLPGATAPYRQILDNSGVGYLDLTYPLLLDPIGWVHPTYNSVTDYNKLAYLRPFYRPYQSINVELSSAGFDANYYYTTNYYTNAYSPYVQLDDNNDFLYSVIWPNFNFRDGDAMIPRSLSRQGMENFFYSHDDIVYGDTATDRNSGNRPWVADETVGRPYPYNETIMPDSSTFCLVSNDLLLRNQVEYQRAGTSHNSYTGEYNWLAMLRFMPKDDPFYECSPDNIYQNEIDVAVCKGGRTSEDVPLIYPVTLEGIGFQGGLFTIDTSASNPNYDPVALKDALKETKWLLLIGDEDTPARQGTGLVYRRFARWYKIANYQIDTNLNTAQLMLVGPDCPKSWESGNRADSTIKAVLFPKVINVFTKTVSVSEQR